MGGVERHGSGGPYEEIVGYSRVIRAGDLVVVAGSTALMPDGVIAGIAPVMSGRAARCGIRPTSTPPTSRSALSNTCG